MLDTEVLLNVIPKCYRNLKLSQIDTYFSMARGYQGDAQIRLNGNKPFEEYLEAKALGIETKPVLVTDLTKEDVCLFETLYKKILADKGNLRILLQTYFGDIRDCYENVVGMDFAGVVNGKNIWRCNYENTLTTLGEIKKYAKQIVLSTSCSLLHVPYTLENEKNPDVKVKQYFSFAVEKLQELLELGVLTECDDYKKQFLDCRHF